MIGFRSTEEEPAVQAAVLNQGKGLRRFSSYTERFIAYNENVPESSALHVTAIKLLIIEEDRDSNR